MAMKRSGMAMQVQALLVGSRVSLGILYLMLPIILRGIALQATITRFSTAGKEVK